MESALKFWATSPSGDANGYVSSWKTFSNDKRQKTGFGGSKSSESSSSLGDNIQDWFDKSSRTTSKPGLPSAFAKFFNAQDESKGPNFVDFSSLQQPRLAKDSLLARLAAHKPFVVEPRGSLNFNKTMAYYSHLLEHGAGGGTSGVIFFGVCRGKASEGFDFSDRAARTVLVTGIPFPNIQDKQTSLKRKYWY